MIVRLIVVASFGLGLAACGSKTLYQWGDYQPALLGYYKGGDVQKFEERLATSITLAEQEQRVPPGLYAEMGYLLYERGDSQGAIAFFTKERDLWPESAVFMQRLIDRIQARGTAAVSGTEAAPAAAAVYQRETSTNSAGDNPAIAVDSSGS